MGGIHGARGEPGMRQLLLLRHAKSAWDDPNTPDRARPLNRRGERASAAIGRAMSELGFAPELILASPARRSMQTLAALAPLPENVRIETPEALYLADAETLLRLVRDLPEAVRCVLVIAHNPGMHELAARIAGRRPGTPDSLRLAQSFPTAALAEFAVSGNWREVGPQSAKLVRFLLPRDLPELAA